MAAVNDRIVDSNVEVLDDATARVMLASLERNLLSDADIRRLIRHVFINRFTPGHRLPADIQLSDLIQFAQSLREMPIAIKTEEDKSELYELPTSFCKLLYGKYMKFRQNFSAKTQNWLFHMRNYQDLLKKISMWMKSDGLLFVEHCCHKTYPLLFEDVNDDDWLTKHFFNGATIPSANLLLYFQDDVSVVSHWLVNGWHFAQTSEKWLENVDHNMSSIKPIMESTYGKDSAVKWTVYWRTFFIALAEFFGYNNGDEWTVTHLLFKRK